MKTFMPSLKGKIPDEVKSRVIKEITCPVCKACYVGMTSRHLRIQLEEHRKESAPVAQHLKSCGVSDFSARIIDSCFNVVELAALESLSTLRNRNFPSTPGIPPNPKIPEDPTKPCIDQKIKHRVWAQRKPNVLERPSKMYTDKNLLGMKVKGEKKV